MAKPPSFAGGARVWLVSGSRFAVSTANKSRLNFLDLLRAGHTDYVLNAEALAYMKGYGLAEPMIARLAAAVAGLYVFHLAGAWRAIYVGTAIASLYLNVLVGVAQSFQKLSFLNPLAPTQSEPPFLVAQGIVLVVFIVLGFLAVRRFHPQMRMT